jgi:hypothetical protein
MLKDTRVYKTIPIVVMSLALSACAVSRVDPMSIPLAYKQRTETAGVVAAWSCNSISQVQAIDARSDKQALGLRTHESKPLKADVTVASDPAPWVLEGVQSLLTQNGISFGGGGPKLIVALNSLHTVESIWHRSSYEAHMTLAAQLQSPTGRVCWKEADNGEASNHGYSGSIENYQETLNMALDDASKHIAESKEFKDALCHCAD